MFIRSFISSLVISLVCFLVSPDNSLGDAPDLVNRVPPGANVIAYVNVEAMLNSKVARQENWRSMMSNAYSAGPLIVPPDAKQVMMASWLEPTTVEPIWEVSVIQLSKPVSMKRIASDANGFTDALGGKLAAWSPANAYYVRLDKQLLGVVCPADRQFAARWTAGAGSSAETLSPYLRAAVDEIKQGTGYFFALDLQDAVGEKRVRRRLDMGEFDCLADKKFDARKVSEIIASVKGLKLTVEVHGDIRGKCAIEFGRPVAALSAFAQPLLMEILEKAGASIDDIAGWKFTTSDTSILASGSLSTEGLRLLCSIINPPHPTDTEETADQPGDEGKSKGESPSNAQVAASKQYYRSVSKTIDGFGARARTATSLAKGATYVGRDARNISRLPIVNVDPELVQWGASVSSQLLQVASTLGVSGLQARAKAESILNPYESGGYQSELEIRSDPNAEIDRQNAARQRRAAVAEEKTKALEQATQILLQLEAGRSQIRAAMTQKYNAEF
ncbi:MAG TPA: hypothetical protein VJZ71_07655 [Phycisphaerae bacterium]|nr:hypothetical protein [Phycisphaerae bacterium]